MVEVELTDPRIMPSVQSAAESKLGNVKNYGILSAFLANGCPVYLS